MGIWLRILGIALNALGAIVLAIRVKRLMDTLVLAQKANDANFRTVIGHLNGQPQTVPLVVDMNEQAVGQQKRGIWLLVAGFLCIAAGNALVGLSWYLEQA